jgi:hypothetical protein
MKERKNIERLFQEKFQNFDATPAPQVWENIASKLEEKESKKRIIPFWFNLKAAGIAASLVIGFFVINNNANLLHFKQDNNRSTILVLTEKDNEKPSANELESALKNQKLAKENNVVENQNSYHLTEKGSNFDSHKSENKISTPKLKNEMLNNSKSNSIAHSSTFEIFMNQNAGVSKSKTNVINHQTINSSSTPLKYSLSNKNKVLAGNEKISFPKNSKNRLTQQSPNSNIASSEIIVHKKKSNESMYLNKKKQSKYKENQVSFGNSKNQIAANTDYKSTKKRASKKAILNSPALDEIQHAITPNDAIADRQKASSNLHEKAKVNQTNAISNSASESQNPETIAQTTSVAKDSVIIAVAEENALEKIAKEKESNDKEEKQIATNHKRWKVKPNVAPLFTNATKGSPIDSQFANNEKSYESTMSLGLGVDYAVSKRISIRTGIHKFEYSYNTKNIVYYADLASKNESSVRNLKTIDVAPEAKNMIIENKALSVTPEIATQTKEDGLLNQKTGYLEIPVEISYKLLDKKFGIQFITGFSSLFLNENRISVISSGLTTVVGEANNLNKIHFSTNIGLGFKYSFWKSFEANFEPTFKYQINTYKTDSGGFKPYFIGLYSGLSFKF